MFNFILQSTIDYFSSKIEYIDKQLKQVPQKKVYYEYKKQGTTTIPGDYFYQMLVLAHADNIFKDAQSVNIDIEAVVEKNPEVIIKVGDVGVDPKYKPPGEAEFLKRKQEIVNRPGWDSIRAVQDNKILLLTQYAHGGASKLIGAMYIAKYLYPEQLPDLHPEEVFKHWVTKYQGLSYLTGNTYPEFRFED